MEELFHQALEREGEARRTFLDTACQGDDDLRNQVESLLGADEEAGEFLETPAATVRAAYSGAAENDRIGPYRLIRPLGAGAMGEVFLAVEDGDEFKRYVAVKIARVGVSGDFLRRFARERAILAQMTHPGIARFLGGGATDDGRPYVVMEFVEGERIDRYADRTRLTIAERVDLFRRVCAAVQHAHASLIVHRDLKPDHILVTEDGDPKLLDFGIAKLLGDDEVDLTRTGLRLATPAYAAPEQLQGEPVGTSADVYALGAILYELLVGHRAFPAAMARARAGGNTTASPPPPSAVTASGSETSEGLLTAEEIGQRRRIAPAALRRTLRSELDNIVLKALEGDPSQRYVSAAAMADDLERYLKGEPVRARPPSPSYRFRKFVGRNRVAVTATSALLLTMAASTAVTWSQNRRIAQQASQLESDRDRAREIQGFLLETFGGAGAEDQAGEAVTVRDLLDRRAEQVDQLYADDPPTRGEMLHVLAEGYERLGQWEEAQAWAERAVEERRELDAPTRERDLAGSLGLLGWILHQRGEVEQAEEPLRESVSIWRNSVPDSAGLSRSLNDLCGVVTSLGRPDEAEALCLEALEIRRAFYPPNHRSIAVTANNLGNAVGLQGRRDESLEWAQESARILEAALGPGHRRTLFAKRNVAVGHAWLGEWESSAEIAKEVVDGFEALAGPSDVDLAWSLQSYGAALGQLGRYSEADSALTRAHRIASGQLGDHPLTAYLLDQRRGLMQRSGRAEEALDLARESVRMHRRIYSGDHPDLANAWRRQGEVATDPTEVVESFQAARDMYVRLEGEEGRGAVQATLALGRGLIAAGRPRESIPLFEGLSEAAVSAYGTDHPLSAASYLGRAEAYARAGDRDEAERFLAEAEERLTGSVDTPGNRAWLERVQVLLAGR